MTQEALWMKLDALIYPSEYRLTDRKAISWNEKIALRCECDPPIPVPAAVSPSSEDELHRHCYIVSRMLPNIIPSAEHNSYVNVYLPSLRNAGIVIGSEAVVLSCTAVLGSAGR